MANPPPPGRCVHCLDFFDVLTWDHVFPEAWYPSTTPKNIEKWKIPSCGLCNAEHGKSEGELLVRFGLCVDPDDLKSAGIAEKALRALTSEMGKNEKDIRSRAGYRKKILNQILEEDAIPYQSVYPGFGPQPGIHDEVRVAIPISAAGIRRLVEKVVRGITYVQDKRFVESPYKIEQFVLTDEGAAPIKEILNRFGQNYECGPGISVTRAVVPEDQMTAVYGIEIWGQLNAYAVLSREQPA